MRWMFDSTNAFNQDISAWNVSKVTNMWQMFHGAEAFNQRLCWDLNPSVDTRQMFDGTRGGSIDPNC